MKIHNQRISSKAIITLLAVLQVVVCGQVSAQSLSFESTMITATRVFMPNRDFMIGAKPESLTKKLVLRKVTRLTPAFHQWQSDFELQSWKRHTGQLPAVATGTDYSGKTLIMNTQGEMINVKQSLFAKPISASLNSTNLNVATLESTWVSSDRDWEVSAIMTDPGNERLFSNLSDLSSMGADMLRQAPSRHLWLRLQRKF